jgi:hypothetical protein
VIDVSARVRERQIGVLIAPRLSTRRARGTELDGADQPQWPLGDVLPMPKGQPVTPLGRAAQDAREGVQAGGVDEIESENRSCYSVKRAAEPDDQRPSSASPGNHEPASRDRLASVTGRGLDAPEALAVGLQTGRRERYSR